MVVRIGAGGRTRRRAARRVGQQLELAFPRAAWGGRRKGAGRKRAEGGSFGHERRPEHLAPHPVHVVLKARFRSFRTQFVFPTVRRALADAARALSGFRIVQFSVQADHVHLIVEARSRVTLSRGMQGLAIRIARRVNALASRTGKLWKERYFARELTSPRAVRNALAYVLNNFRKHRGTSSSAIDPYSSAPYFSGFAELRGRAPVDLARRAALILTPRGVAPPECAEHVPIVQSRTWLAQRGWRRAGSIGFRTFSARDLEPANAEVIRMELASL